MEDKCSIVVAVDFGAYGSAIAIGVKETKHVAVISPLEEAVEKSSVFKSVSWRSEKVPTKLVLDARTKKLLYFGETAADKYDKRNEKQDDFLLFEHFKMTLDFANNNVKKNHQSLRSINLSARCGRVLPLMTVLTEMLRHFKETAIERLNQRGVRLPILWMLTVPTSWDEAAKQFMREAAKDAGMDQNGDQIGLALESEAAAVACNDWVLGRHKSSLSKQLYLAPGKKVLVVDAGGGTTDCTLHEVDRLTGQLTKAAHSSPEGNSVGGQSVDANFEQLLDRTFGGNWMGSYQLKYPADARTISRAIQKLKHEVDPTATTNEKEYLLPLPTSFILQSGLDRLTESGKKSLVLDFNADPHATRAINAPADPPSDVKSVASTDADDDEWDMMTMSECKMMSFHRIMVKGEGLPPDGKRLCYGSGHLRFSQKLALSMFTATIERIVKHVDQICKREPLLSCIFPVGGFCESPILIHALQQLFITKVDEKDTKNDTKTASSSVLVVCTENPVEAVLKGAVLYGFNRESIRSRVVRHSVGTDRSVRWLDPEHKHVKGCEKRARTVFNAEGIACSDPICPNHFRSVVKSGDVISFNENYTAVCHPSYPGQTEVVIRFFATTNANAARVDQPDVSYLGKLTIPMPICDGGLNRKIQYSVAFGGTHLTVNAKDLTSNQSQQASLDFLD